MLNTRLEGQRGWWATYFWARTYFWATVSVEGLDHLNTWFARLDASLKTQAALQLAEPRPSAFGKNDIEAAAAANAARFKI